MSIWIHDCKASEVIGGLQARDWYTVKGDRITHKEGAYTRTTFGSKVWLYRPKPGAV